MEHSKTTSKAYGAITLEKREILSSIDRVNSLELKAKGEIEEFYEVGESIELLALYKNNNGNFDNMFAKLKKDEYKIVASDSSKVSILGNRITFLESGEVAIKMQGKTQEGLIKFKVIDKDGVFIKNKNPLDVVIIIGKDSENRELERAFIKNGNELYLFALTLTDAENIKYFNSIDKNQPIADIDKNFGKDNVVLQNIVDFENIKNTIEAIPESTSPLIMHIIGHGSANSGGKIVLEQEYLPAVGLRNILDNYQNNTGRDVIVIVDACYSGAFAKTLKNQNFNRLVITSVNESEPAIMAPLDGTSYSKYLKEHFDLGETLGVSFDKSSKLYRDLASNSLSPTIDGAETLENFKVPNPKVTSNLNELFLNYNFSETITLNDSKELFVEIKLSEFERKTLIDNAVYAKVTPPQTVNLNVQEFTIPTIEIEKVSLEQVKSNSKSIIYRANYTFDKNGVYSIAFAIENNVGNTIETLPIKIKTKESIEKQPTLFLSTEDNENRADNFYLNQGWNLVASPIKEGFNTSKLSNIEVIWSYYNGEWTLNPDRVEADRGYWIKTDKEQSYKFDGTEYSLNFENLESGWNLVGTGERVYKFDFDNLENIYTYQSDGSTTPNKLSDIITS